MHYLIVAPIGCRNVFNTFYYAKKQLCTMDKSESHISAQTRQTNVSTVLDT